MNAIKKIASTAAYLESGTVERITAGSIAVRLGNGVLDARRAKSCLVAPEASDKVLCAIEPEEIYVLAVLEGQPEQPTRLIADGDLELSARGGRVAVSAGRSVDIVSGGAVAMTSAELHVRAGRGSVAVEELGYLGRLVRAEVTKVALFAQEVDSVLSRLSQRARRVFRFVEEIDQTRAGTIDMRAEELMGIRGENTVISARVLAKLDGEQVHIG
jgi:hypothetical protein